MGGTRTVLSLEMNGQSLITQQLTNTVKRRSPFGTEEFGLVLDRPSDASPQEKELLGLVGS